MDPVIVFVSTLQLIMMMAIVYCAPHHHVNTQIINNKRVLDDTNIVLLYLYLIMII